jgi:hypothetical protein
LAGARHFIATYRLTFTDAGKKLAMNLFAKQRPARRPPGGCRRSQAETKHNQQTNTSMENPLTIGAALFCGIMLSTAIATAGDAKDYQVTGPVTEITATTITVKKGNDLWQINRDAGTKVKGDPKVGARVTVHYSMTATDIEVKPGKAKEAGGN